ncbi:MAG: hypothetical protein ACI376_05285 [Candidatus Bruticola sp.]
MNERWTRPQLSLNAEKNGKNRDGIFGCSVTAALLAICGLDMIANNLLKVPTLLCFLILISTFFIVFLKERSDKKPHSWLVNIIKAAKAIGISIFWILLINKLF